jgi:hypothetical protein
MMIDFPHELDLMIPFRGAILILYRLHRSIVFSLAKGAEDIELHLNGFSSQESLYHRKLLTLDLEGLPIHTTKPHTELRHPADTRTMSNQEGLKIRQGTL